MILQRKKLAFALLPAAALLAACQVDTTLSLSEDETISLVLSMNDDEGIANGMTCQDVEDNLGGEFPYVTDFQIDDNGSDPLSCTFTATFDDTFYNMAVSKSGDSYKVEIPEEFWTSFNDSAQIESFGTIDSTFTIEFPGEVTDASNGGKINGNSVTWEGYDTLSKGISATGGAGTAVDPVDPTTPSTETTSPTTTDEATSQAPVDTQEDEDSGIPVWVWIIAAVVVIAIIVAVILFMRGRNKGNAGQGDPRVPGGYVPDGRTPYGAPANPAQGGAPYAQPTQFQQPGQAPQQFGHPQPGGQDPLQYGQSPQPGANNQYPENPQQS